MDESTIEEREKQLEQIKLKFAKHRITSFDGTFKVNHSKKWTSKIIKTGVPVIDDPLMGGLSENEFLLIASGSGIGKTALASMIGERAAKKGHKVLLFALEAYNGELQDRIKLREIKLRAKRQLGRNIEFQTWYNGNNKSLVDIEEDVIKDLHKQLNNKLDIIYRRENEDFTIERFSYLLDTLYQEIKPDLIIIDHLHFFDYGNEKSENIAQRKIVKKLRDITLHYKTPIVLLGQFRKDLQLKTVVPTIHDIMGSSDIVKCVTSVLNVCEGECEELTNNRYNPTYFYWAKNRFNSKIKKYVLLTAFDHVKEDYIDAYKPLLISKNMMKLSDVRASYYPRWMVETITSTLPIYIDTHYHDNNLDEAKL